MAKKEEDYSSTGGIGCKCEETKFGGFVTITGGSLEQRLIQRDYSKSKHAAPVKDPAPPLMDISGPYRIL